MTAMTPEQREAELDRIRKAGFEAGLRHAAEHPFTPERRARLSLLIRPARKQAAS